jgi:quercetin 2,3-dioxygenase
VILEKRQVGGVQNARVGQDHAQQHKIDRYAATLFHKYPSEFRTFTRWRLQMALSVGFRSAARQIPNPGRRKCIVRQKTVRMFHRQEVGMITVRKRESICQTQGEIQNGTFFGRWHFSFGEYYDPQYLQFGTLRVFNDDTLSPGAVWPLHPHREIEVVTYCAAGRFRHADEHGEGGILQRGWVQHTTVGTGLFHSEINDLPDQPMRFIQMWFIPRRHGLPPGVEQKRVEQAERTNILLPLVSNEDEDALKIASDARVYSCFLSKDRTVAYEFGTGYGGYLYVMEGGDITAGGQSLRSLDAAMIQNEPRLVIKAMHDAELLLAVVPLTDSHRKETGRD